MVEILENCTLGPLKKAFVTCFGSKFFWVLKDTLQEASNPDQGIHHWQPFCARSRQSFFHIWCRFVIFVLISPKILINKVSSFDHKKTL